MYPNTNYNDPSYQGTGGYSQPPQSSQPPQQTFPQGSHPQGTTSSESSSSYGYYPYGYGQYNQSQVYPPNYPMVSNYPQGSYPYPGYNSMMGYSQGPYPSNSNLPPPPGYPSGPSHAPTHSAFAGSRKRKRSPDNDYRTPQSTGGRMSRSNVSNSLYSAAGYVPLRQVRVSNIPESLATSPEKLRGVMSKVGRIMCMNIPHFHDTGKPRNYAFVKYSTEAEAARACNELNGTEIEGSVFEVVIANKQAEYSGRTNTIQVENLPYEAQDTQIRNQFEKHGPILKFKLVKHHKSKRATAIIEYEHGSSVQAALNEFHDDIYVGEAVETPSNEVRTNKRRKYENYDEEEYTSPQFDENICEVYVGRLPPQLSSNKDELRRIFEPYGPIENITFVYDHNTGAPKNAAHIRYQTASAAAQACKYVNQTVYYDQAILVQLSRRQQQEQSNPKSSSGELPDAYEVYVANLPSNLTEDDVRNNLCSMFTASIEKVHLTEFPPTAFIRFDAPETATRAITELNSLKFMDRVLFARNSFPSDSRSLKFPLPMEDFNNEVHVGNLPYGHCSESVLENIFSICGKIKNVRLPTPHRQSNVPRGFAFIQFEDLDSAMRAISLHGMTIENRSIHVSFPNLPKVKSGSSQPKESGNRYQNQSNEGPNYPYSAYVHPGAHPSRMNLPRGSSGRSNPPRKPHHRSNYSENPYPDRHSRNGNYDHGYDSKHDRRYDAKYDPSHESRYNQNYHSNYNPSYDQGYNSRYEPKYDPNYDAKYEPKYDPKYNSNYDSKREQPYGSNYKAPPPYDPNYTPEPYHSNQPYPPQDNHPSNTTKSH